jgi:hypothetical protein
MRQIKEILEEMTSQEKELGELLKKLNFEYANKHWHEFGESILELIYHHNNFDSLELL